MLRDTHREIARPDTHEWAFIPGGDHHDGSCQSVGAEGLLDELDDFTTSLANKCDHIHFGAGVACDRTYERALSHSGTSEDPESLTAPDGVQSIDGADAGGDRVIDGGPRERTHAVRVQRPRAQSSGRVATVDGAPETVDGAPQQRGADRYRCRIALANAGVTGRDAARLVIEHHDRGITLESDDLPADR